MFQLGFKLKLASLLAHSLSCMGMPPPGEVFHLAQTRASLPAPVPSQQGYEGRTWGSNLLLACPPFTLVHTAVRVGTHLFLDHPAASLKGPPLESEMLHRLMFYAFASLFVTFFCSLWTFKM